MKPHARVTREVVEGSDGRKTAAFFDLDGTLISGFSVFFFLYRRYLNGQVSPGEAFKQFRAIGSYGLKQTGFSELLAEFTLSMSGLYDHDLWELAEEVFRKDLSGRMYPESRALVKAHQDKGHTVVILSSATQYQLAFIADELGVDEVICTQLEVQDGKLTGQMKGPACYGMEKCLAAKEFADRHDIDLTESYFYSDGIEDLPLLAVIGHPRPLNADDELATIARANEWPLQNFDSRGLPDIADIIRTALVYGSFLPSFMVGAPAWLLNRSRRDVINLGLSVWGDFGSAVAGLEVNVSGEEHLWSHRPAVFIFNHQSATDMLIVARLLRQDYTGLTKREMKNNPLLGPALSFADAVFIDRAGTASAAEAMQPALEKLESGLSIAIAPEGSRSPGYKLGAFKKGAFHIAMQAGVPIIPIVIANSSDALPKSGIFIRPATVEVAVLPPVSTAHWSTETMDEHVRQSRELYLRALGQGGQA